MSPLVTYQFHQFTDVHALMHVVKDSEIVQIKWAPGGAAGQVVLVNGQTISLSLADLNSLVGQVTFPQVAVDASWTSDGEKHVLNKDRIDNVEWRGSDPDGVIVLSNRDKITVVMNSLIQIITVLTNTINPQG